MFDDLGLQLQSLLGIFVFLAIAWSLGPRKSVPIVLIVGAVLIQFLIASALFLLPPARDFLYSLTEVVTVLQRVTEAGTSFVLGYVGTSNPNALPFAVREDSMPGAAFSLALQALPMVIVLSAISALLWYWGILKWIVKGFAFLFERTLGLSGAASLGAAANIFLGMTESPVLIKPRLPSFSKSDLFLIMTVGFSTVAGSVMAIYAIQLQDVLDGAAGHVFTASLISIPAAVVLSRLMYPQEVSTEAETEEKVPVEIYNSTMHSLTKGTTDGGRLFINIVLMLIVFTALIELVNVLFGYAPNIGGEPLSAQRILGWIFAPLVWLAGVPWSEAASAGTVMGFKTALNEIFGYIELSQRAGELSDRTTVIMTYAVCGFANFASMGILIGGLTAITPSTRHQDILELAPRALISGTLATLMTGAVVGALPTAWSSL